MSSLKLPGGVKLNLSKKGVGTSISKKNFGIGIGPNGGRVRVGIPGTGISYSESITLDKLKKLKEAFFGKPKEQIDDDIKTKAEPICIMCGAKVTEFKTEQNKKIFLQEGLCQKCQEEYF